MEFRKLTKEEEKVLLEKGTEAPFSGKYEQFSGKGVYSCKRCGNFLYRSESKFNSGCGWPSFDEEIIGALKEVMDTYSIRTEITCSRCGAHLGHVFRGEKRTPKNTRFCVNSISMDFIPDSELKETKEIIYLGGGCFWCTEAVFKRVKGVLGVVPGYAGGKTENPSYEEVCSGKTGHAEIVKVEFDKTRISLEGILNVFFSLHDPTTLNRQGDDIGDQYRSLILYNNLFQKEIIENYIKKLEEEKVFEDKIVTEVKKFDKFYPAEDYYKDYYERNKGAPYCQIVISPKIEKLEKFFKK